MEAYTKKQRTVLIRAQKGIYEMVSEVREKSEEIYKAVELIDSGLAGDMAALLDTGRRSIRRAGDTLFIEQE